MELLYTDERIVVCLKPPGVLSTDEPGGMPELLRRALGLDASGCVRVVHRLDRPVGGVMVYARSRMADRLLSQQVQAHRFEKDYLAVLQGIPAAPQAVLEDYLRRDAQACKTAVVSGPGPDARPARLSYRLLAAADGCSLVCIRLLTGRTHQIRAQFSARGLPLAGDRKYGAEAAEYPLALWSYRLRFFHPQTGQPVEFCCLPPDTEPWRQFSGILRTFEKGENHVPDERT